MSVPKVMPSPRQMIHQKFCAVSFECRYDGATAPGNQSYRCEELDQLLDFNDEMLLHTEAKRFDEEMHRLSREHRSGAAGVSAGLYRAMEMLDPFKKIEAFDEDPEEFTHPGEERPDCPACVKGVEHFHRKKDGSPVVVPCST